jgi:hypothetical protein
MKASNKTDPAKTWEKTSQQNLVRHKSGRYYCPDIRQQQRNLEEPEDLAFLSSEGEACHISARAPREAGCRKERGRGQNDVRGSAQDSSAKPSR